MTSNANVLGLAVEERRLLVHGLRLGWLEEESREANHAQNVINPCQRVARKK